MEDFKALTSQAPEMTELQLLRYYLGGLREDILSWVKTLKPLSLAEAIELSIEKEFDYGIFVSPMPILLKLENLYDMNQ